MADRLDEIERSLRDDVVTIRPKSETVPPKSEYAGRHWTPGGVVLVITAFGGLMTTVGALVGPLLMKPDMTGWVKEERLTKCEEKLEAKEEAAQKRVDDERERTRACYQKLGDCQSNLGASEVVIESLGKKRR